MFLYKSTYHFIHWLKVPISNKEVQRLQYLSLSDFEIEEQTTELVSNNLIVEANKLVDEFVAGFLDGFDAQSLKELYIRNLLPLIVDKYGLEILALS